MNVIKKFLQAVVVGAGTWFGIHLATKGIKAVADPYKRGVVKHKLTRIKDVLFEKEEE